MKETVTLMRKHGCATAGELKALGLAIPMVQVADRILCAYKQGELTDNELEELGIGSPWTLKPQGQG
jgi:hypothetical protein